MSAVALLERDPGAHSRGGPRPHEREPLPLRRLCQHRGGGPGSRRRRRLMPRLVKTEAVIEGRVEERWVLVDDDDTPEWAQDERPPVIGREATRHHRPGARHRHGPLHLRHQPAGHARGARAAQPPRQRAAGVDRSGRRPRGSRCARVRRSRRRPPSTTASAVLTDEPALCRRRGRGRCRRDAPTPPPRHSSALAAAVRGARLPRSTSTRASSASASWASRATMSVATPRRRSKAADVTVETDYRAPAQLHNALEIALRRGRLATRTG